MNSKYLTTIISIILFFYGIFIISTKQLPQGNGGMGIFYVNIGNFAYVIGALFIMSSLFIIFKAIKK